jgi:hypothetical protein
VTVFLCLAERRFSVPAYQSFAVVRGLCQGVDALLSPGMTVVGGSARCVRFRDLNDRPQMTKLGAKLASLATQTQRRLFSGPDVRVRRAECLCLVDCRRQQSRQMAASRALCGKLASPLPAFCHHSRYSTERLRRSKAAFRLTCSVSIKNFRPSFASSPSSLTPAGRRRACRDGFKI